MFGLIPFETCNINDKGGRFEDFLSDFFNDGFENQISLFKGVNEFSADVRETDNEYLVSAELPGVNKEDIRLNYENENLIIRARREEFHDESKDSYIRRERNYGEFSRAFHLGNVNKEGIRAKFENGELKIILPKQVRTKTESSSIFIE